MFFGFYQPCNFLNALSVQGSIVENYNMEYTRLTFIVLHVQLSHETIIRYRMFFSGSCVFCSICPINCGQRHNVLFNACAAREWIICTTVTLAPMAIWNHLIVWWIAASFWKSQIMVWQASVLLVKMKTLHMHCMQVRICYDFLFWRVKRQLTVVQCW